MNILVRIFVVGVLILNVVNTATTAVYEEVYTQDELQALQEFRPLARKLVRTAYQKNDIYLIHWLRARKLDLKDSIEMLEKAMTWRKQNNVEAVLEDKDMIEAVRRTYPVGYGVFRDKGGRPALQTAFARMDLRKGYLTGFDFQRFLMYSFEKISTMAFHGNLSGFIHTTDLNQFSLRQQGCLACLSFYIDFLNLYENYYPNMCFKQIIFNTPRIFDQILTMVRPLMSPHTRENLEIFGVDKREWQAGMLKYFDADQLPKSFGGNKAGGYQD